MSNQSFRRQGARTLAFLAATLGLAACGDSSTAPDVPQLIEVEFEASGVVEHEGQPVCGAKIVLMRCDRMGVDGCAEETAIAIAMTNPKGQYALRYTCVCDPSQDMPQHSLQIEMPAVVSWDRLASERESRLARLVEDPGDSGGQADGPGKERRGHFTIDPKCVDRLIIKHDFSLSD
jgi:hypothetical protein